MDPPDLYRYPVQHVADPAAVEAQRRLTASLEDAIATTPIDNLRFHVKFACKQCPIIRQRMCEALLAAEDEIPVTEGEDGGSSDDSSSADSLSEKRTPSPGPSERPSEAQQTNGESSGEPVQRNDESATQQQPQPTRPKRFVTRYAICAVCDEEFDVTDNTPTSCHFHPEFGQFEDADLYRPGEIDEEEYSKLYPEKFWYDCCDGNGEEPCEQDWHREKKHVSANLKKRKRRRLC